MRASKTVGDVTTQQIWLGDEIALDITGENVVSYIHGLKLIESDYGYYLYNAHGDVTGLVSGTDIKRFDYDPYGNQISADDSQNPYRYCGEYTDFETGYVYLRARYYDPEIGGFISVDPAKDGGNWYAYCAGNPVGLVDPSGENAIVVTDSGAAGGYGHTSVIAEKDGTWYYFYWGDNNFFVEAMPSNTLADLSQLNAWLKSKGADAIKHSSDKPFSNSCYEYDFSTYIEGDFSKTVEYYQKKVSKTKFKKKTKKDGSRINKSYNVATNNCLQQSFKGLNKGKLPSGKTIKKFARSQDLYLSKFVPNYFRDNMSYLFSNTQYTKIAARSEVLKGYSNDKKNMWGTPESREGRIAKKYADMLDWTDWTT